MRKQNPTRSLIQQLSNARTSIIEMKGITENIEKLRSTFDQLGPAIKEQQVQLKQMSPSSSVQKDGQEKLQEQKKYFLRFIDIISEEYDELIGICKDCFNTRDKKEQVWEKMLYSKEKYLSILKENITAETNYFELIFRHLNLRDHLIGQVLKGLLYQKLLLWKDMNIKNEPYVHAFIKNILTSIEIQMTRDTIVNTKPIFKIFQWDTPQQGVWRYLTTIDSKDSDNQQDNFPVSVYLKLTYNCFSEMLYSLSTLASLSADPQQIAQITTNQNNVRTLRELISQLSIENQEINVNYNELKSNVRTNDFESQKRLTARNNELEQILQRKEREINELMSNSKGSLNQIQNLREKLKDLDEENHRLNNQFYPKLRETEAQQTRLFDEFQKLKKDIDTYSSLFKIESQMREKAINDKEFAESQVQKLVDMLGKQKQKTKDCNSIIQQKELIITKIVESRRESIQGINELKTINENQEKQIQTYINQLEELNYKFNQLENKYQEMFEINTHFNKRIYELEKQKKDYLDLLRYYKIEPDQTKFTVDGTKLQNE